MMSKTSDQMGLFGDIGSPRPAIRPWRPTRLDLRSPDDEALVLSDPEDSRKASELLYDVLLRNAEFRRALELKEIEPDDDWSERFLEAEKGILTCYLVLRMSAALEDPVEDVEKEVLAGSREAAAVLVELRRELLESLGDEDLDRLQKAEARVKADEITLRRELAGLELGFAEEEGLLQEIVVELPMGGPAMAGSGLLGPDDVDWMVDLILDEQKEEQDTKPLPKQGKLRTLLKGLPAVWLDAVAQALDLPIEGRRGEREKAIAERLRDPEVQQRLLRDRLEARERELLELVVKGPRPVEAIYQEFGNDEDDGWFWNESLPTSVLGRLRLHGLVFVGYTDRHGVAAIVPKELREDLEELL